ncbi:hypothetical protein Klosneuvirus_3_221 [Klosneuvirus KNV1]|uniref:Uncharacterized protein n=1 Tax=Klosneuvirus KNV1 TaxID=1977640 RepID=A0A1V0SK41_9VIRU|nr:hypothetical protein Klosneuvirus_3_221 [Klosneuvirus KNV1]
MAYANAIMFYGWSGDEANKLVTKITKTKMVELKRQDDNTDKFVKSINDTFKKIKAPIQLQVFDGGLGNGKDKTNCIPYVYFKCHSVESAGDDDFDEKGFTIKEMKEMFNSSFEFSKTFTGNPPPMMKVLVNSDTK